MGSAFLGLFLFCSVSSSGSLSLCRPGRLADLLLRLFLLLSRITTIQVPSTNSAKAAATSPAIVGTDREPSPELEGLDWLASEDCRRRIRGGFELMRDSIYLVLPRRQTARLAVR